MNTSGLAFDRATVRKIDADGRMHVALSPISKANVCPYFGREIPGGEALGLEPERIYQLYRDPGELARAAGTFNNIPLLNQHIAVSAADPQKEAVVGATGTDAVFNDPFLSNSLVIWDASAIAGIQTGEQRELSSAYRYVADMTPGVAPDGTPYDGRMTEIVGNHVALVPVGRAGADVLVSDSLPTELTPMKKSQLPAVRAALGACLLPIVAMDSALPKIRELTTKPTTLEKLAEDAAKVFPEVDKSAVLAALKFALDEADDVPVPPKGASDEDDEDDPEKKKQGQDEDDEDKDQKANDEDDEKDKKPAMDAALISQIRTDARKDAMAEFNALRKAEADVRPLVGDVAAMDSAAAVYRVALDSLGIEHKGVHPSAYPALIAMRKSQSSEQPKVALDASAAGDFAKRYPTAGKVSRA